MARPKKLVNLFKSSQRKPLRFADDKKSQGILDDFPIRKHVETRSGHVHDTPTANEDMANKGYVDSTVAATVSDTAYGASWNGVTDVAPSKNAVYDQINSMGAAGEANTASSAGSGTSIFHQKSGVDLEFNAIKSENDRLSVGLDGVTHDVELTLVEGNIDHDNLSGFVANEHLDWTQDSVGTIHTSNFTALQNVSEDTTPELGGEMDCGAHSIGFTQQTGTGDGTTTIDWRLGNKYQFTFGAQNETFTFTAPSNPCNLVLKMIQDGVGSRTATWPATCKWPSGDAPTLTTDASAVDIICFYYDGTNYYGVESLDFS